VTTYVALLRAINLGKNRKIPMAELRTLAHDLGFAGVQTLIQSGNLVFASPNSPTNVTATLEAALSGRFNFDVPVILRTAEEIAGVAKTHPFGEDEGDPAKLHVVFYATAPSREAVSSIDASRFAPDRFVVSDREAFVHYPDGAGRSKLNLDGLGPGTARNWRTVQAIAEMVRGD
jgi:uncharacterized protein (DUF1697 family)